MGLRVSGCFSLCSGPWGHMWLYKESIFVEACGIVLQSPSPCLFHPENKRAHVKSNGPLNLIHLFICESCLKLMVQWEGIVLVGILAK